MSPAAAVYLAYLAAFGVLCDVVGLLAIMWWIASRRRCRG